VLRVRSGASWDEVGIRLVPGQKPEDFDEAARALASARAVTRCQVRELSPNVVSIDFQRRNLLADPVACRDLAALVDVEGMSVDLRRVFSGRTEYGQDWLVPLAGGHTLVAGSTGAGKNSAMWCPLVSGTEEAGRHVGYLTKYLTKSIGQAAGLDEHATDTQRDHARRLHAELQVTPCSPRCPVWLLYGIQPKGVRHSMTPGHCKGKAHKAEHLGIAGRRILVSRKWSNKTLDVPLCSTSTRIAQPYISAGQSPSAMVTISWALSVLTAGIKIHRQHRTSPPLTCDDLQQINFVSPGRSAHREVSGRQLRSSPGHRRQRRCPAVPPTAASPWPPPSCTSPPRGRRLRAEIDENTSHMAHNS
jgi:hypothetical protein